MEFTIYDISDVVDNESEDFVFEEYENELTELEMGLSAGEVRQSLLDRFRNAIRNKDIYFVNVNFSKYGLNFEENSLDTEDEEKSKIEDIDNILYDLEDDEISDTMWILPQEVIYVKGEEW